VLIASTSALVIAAQNVREDFAARCSGNSEGACGLAFFRRRAALVVS
jgi:hypothetical protein